MKELAGRQKEREQWREVEGGGDQTPNTARMDPCSACTFTWTHTCTDNQSSSTPEEDYDAQSHGCTHAQTARAIHLEKTAAHSRMKGTHAQTATAAHLKKTAAQAELLLTDAAAVQEGTNHAYNGATLLVADCIEERFHSADGVHACKQGCTEHSALAEGGGGGGGGRTG